MENLRIDNIINNDLKKAAGWIKFLSILLYISMGLVILFSLIGFIMSIVGMSQPYGAEGGAIILILSIIYGIVGSLLCYFPATYGMRFNNKIIEAITHGNQESMQNAFRSLGSWFKFWGIFWIVYIILTIIYLIFVIAFFSSGDLNYY